jgi:hypothetical protein
MIRVDQSRRQLEQTSTRLTEASLSAVKSLGNGPSEAIAAMRGRAQRFKSWLNMFAGEKKTE